MNIKQERIYYAPTLGNLGIDLLCLILQILSSLCGFASKFFESLAESVKLSEVLGPEVEPENEQLQEDNSWEVMMNPDILPEIFKHLSVTYLKECRLVCKQWCESSSDVLSSKSEVHLYTVDRYTGWDEAMENCNFDLTYARHVNHFRAFLDKRKQRNEHGRKLLKYENYRVTFATWLPQQEAVFCQNMRLFMHPEVRKTMVELRAQGRELEWLKYALGNLPNLKSVTLDCDWYGAEGEYADSEFETYPLGNYPFLPRLESLSVIEDKYFRTEMRWHWLIASAPNLQKIHLSLAGEPDMLLSLEKILELYNGPGLVSLSVQFFEYGGGYGCFCRHSRELSTSLQKIVNSKIGRSLKSFNCNVLLSPTDWARVFTPTLISPGPSCLENLTLSIFTGMGRADFVPEFLMFMPTYSGKCYFANLKFLSMKVVDSGLFVMDKGTELVLQSSRKLPNLETLRFYYFSSVSPSRQITGKFFEPFPNLKRITTNVDCNKCVSTIMQSMPSSLIKLSLYCTLSEYMFVLRDEDFLPFLSRAPELEELQLIFDCRELDDFTVTDGLLKLKNFSKLTLGTYPGRFSSHAWTLMSQAGISCNCVQAGRVVPLLTEAEEA